jgi:hypothetical protein
MKNFRNTVRFAIAAAAVLATAALLAQNLRIASADTSAASETPKQLFEEKCSACHQAPDPNAEAKTADGWQKTVNSMLYRHGASDSISTDQAATIVAYLDTFAIKDTTGPRPQAPRFGRSGADSTDVWPTSPIYSHAYNFQSTQVAAPFRNLQGRWSVRPAGATVGPVLVFAAGAPVKPAILIAPSSSTQGDMQIEADFRSAPPPPDTPASLAATIPLTFGLAFGVRDAANYDLASYDDRARTLTLVETHAGVSTTVLTAPLANGLSATPDGWHKLKVMVLGNQAKVWIDYEKLLVATLSTQPATSDAGVWTGTRAAAKSLVVDVYARPTADTAALQ